jgi:putative acetyltransferase
VNVIEIRPEQANDIPAIRHVHREAFQNDQEGNIVDALRIGDGTLLSLVATVDGEVIGHILYSSASVGALAGAALGPMAVRPTWQRLGIGSRLVEAGNRMLRESGCPFVVVVGHATFYPRFGFTPASRRGITCEWNVPDEVFMLLPLDEQAMQGVSGQVAYCREFYGEC